MGWAGCPEWVECQEWEKEEDDTIIITIYKCITLFFVLSQNCKNNLSNSRGVSTSVLLVSYQAPISKKLLCKQLICH